MFTMIGRFFGWVSFRVSLFVADMRYDAAIQDKKKLIQQLTNACAERFKFLAALDDQILQTQLHIEENAKIANGAATAYLDDSQRGSFHRQAGEQALVKIQKWEGKIQEWQTAKDENKKALVELKKACMQAEEDLDFLAHDKPRALSELKAVRQELEIARRNVHWPETIDKRNREQIALLDQYKKTARAQRAAWEFMKADPYKFYKDKEGGTKPASEKFDDLVNRRRGTRKMSSDVSIVRS